MASEVEGKRIDSRGACAQSVTDLCERSDDYYDQWCRESGHGETSRAYWKAKAGELATTLAALQAEKDAEIERVRALVDYERAERTKDAAEYAALEATAARLQTERDEASAAIADALAARFYSESKIAKSRGDADRYESALYEAAGAEAVAEAIRTRSALT